MLKLSWIFAMNLIVVSTELAGDHVCQVKESYPVNVTEFLLKNTTVRNYKWCMGFPPRCSFYTFKTVKVPQVVERLETRTVNKCCLGYARNKENTGCIPCSRCYEGTCGHEGKCICNSGFTGDDCANACGPMFWGNDCKYQCLCERGSCNPRTGECDCPSGWFGTRCELNCLEGFYGKHCINRCHCGERERCSPETGDCIGRRTVPNFEERQTTRSIHFATKNDLSNISDVINLDANQQKSTPSLKKYHTFDMNFNSSKTTPTYKSKFSNKDNMVNKIKYKTEKKYLEKTKDTSVESTTETSEEVPARNVEDLPIINENGSFEKKNVDQDISRDSVNNIWAEDTKSFDTTRNSMKNYRTLNFENSSDLPPKYSETQTKSPTTTLSSAEISASYKTQQSTKSQKTSNIAEASEEFLQSTTPRALKENENRRSFSVEEETLQNLDLPINILTSRETTTSSTTEIFKPSEGVLAFTEVLPPTKGIDENYMENDLPEMEQVEIHNSYKKESFLEKDEASSEFEYSSNSSENNNLAAHMTLTALISFILIAITASVISANHYKRRKRKRETKFKVENHQNYPGGPSVSVYTHSIFHTPLPEPPNFESPLFSPSNTDNDRRTFQTQYAVCNMNFASNSDEIDREYQYDHPPSTGSYRAASIPEPPEAIKEAISLEPLYDEIPFSDRKANNSISSNSIHKSSSLYMNTVSCKTKF